MKRNGSSEVLEDSNYEEGSEEGIPTPVGWYDCVQLGTVSLGRIQPRYTVYVDCREVYNVYNNEADACAWHTGMRTQCFQAASRHTIG